MSEFEQYPSKDPSSPDLPVATPVPSYFEDDDSIISPGLFDIPVSETNSAKEAGALVESAVALGAFRSEDSIASVWVEQHRGRIYRVKERLKKGIDKLHDRFPENDVLPMLSLNFTPRYTVKAMIHAYNRNVPDGAELLFDEESYDKYNVPNKNLNYRQRAFNDDMHMILGQLWIPPQLSLRGLLLDKTLTTSRGKVTSPPDIGSEMTVQTANLADILMSDMVLRTLGRTLDQAYPSLRPDTFLEAQDPPSRFELENGAYIRMNDFRLRVGFGKNTSTSSNTKLVTVNADDEKELR